MSLAEGARLGPYEIVAPLGAGGMGEVYKARDTRLERPVAIKVLPPHFVDNDDLRQRFEREAKTVSNLSHPHICTVHDVGHESGVDYLVMEYRGLRPAVSGQRRQVADLDRRGTHALLDRPRPRGRLPRSRRQRCVRGEHSRDGRLDGGLAAAAALPAVLGRGGIFRNRWVPTAAGDRFLLNARKDAGEAPTFRVVLDWPAELAPR